MSAVSTDSDTPSGNSAVLRGSWFGFDPSQTVWFDYGIGSFTDSTNAQTVNATDGSYAHTIITSFDRSYIFKARSDRNGASSGGTLGFLSFAENPTANAPSSSAITASTATISDVFDPKVVESTFSCQMQYRKFGDVTWINAGSPVASGTSVSANLSGLLGSTTYEFRMLGSRTTANTVNWNSSTGSFTTSASAPTITTNSETSVATTSATLNGAVDPNTISVRVRFGWGLADGGATPGSWGNLTAYQNFSGSGSQSFGQAISGLSASTTYFFRAFVEYPSPGFASGLSGVSRSFTTPVNPLAVAAQEDHMHLPQYDAHFGVQQDFYFTLNSPAGTSSDRLVTTTPGTLFAAGDIQISKDGGAAANVTNAVTQIGTTPLYKLTLTATELQAELAFIIIVDQNGPAFRDLYILIRTKERLGQKLVNASQIGGSAAAMILQPSSGGYSLDATDSAATNIGKIRGFLESMALRSQTAQAGAASTVTLDASASATNNYYNDDIVMIVGGTGLGQARVITGYDGTTKIATVNASWSVNPDSTSRYVIVAGNRTMNLSLAELASIPAAGAAVGVKLQFIFQRFAFKVSQTATLQTLYTSAGVSLGTRSVSDDGTTQQIAKVV